MGIEYKLGETNSGKYQQLECEENSDTIVRSMAIFGLDDGIHFRRKNRDGSTFESYWGLSELRCFKEFKSKSYIRLSYMPGQDVERLAARIYELLFMSRSGENRYNIEPKIDETKPEYQQILKELKILRKTQKRLFSSKKIVSPSISSDEIAWKFLK